LRKSRLSGISVGLVISMGHAFRTICPKRTPLSRPLRYSRFSTNGQTLDAQLDQLRAAGCAKICREKASDPQPTRRELLRMLKALSPGAVVTVTQIDRLARSTFDLFAVVKQIVAAGAQFCSLAEPWVDTPISRQRTRSLASP
jgi:DNA invertase Pin-like site-specific DNA recombinase